MTAETIKFHAAAIAKDTAEANAAFATGDNNTGAMILDAIKFRRAMLAKKGVVIV
jgi:hypothetical protein